MKETLDGFMTAEQQNWRNDIIMQLAKEAKIPPARAMMTTWAQLESPNKMRTTTGREVELPFDDEQYYQLLMERVKTSRRKENVKTVISDLSATYNTGSK